MTNMQVAIIFFLCLLLYRVEAWKGQLVEAKTAHSINSDNYVDVSNLLLTVVTKETNEYVILNVMLSVKFTAANSWMKFTILRNGLPVTSNSLRYIKSTNANEVQPVVISIADRPGIINSYTYKVQAAGYGALGDGNRMRQFSCIQIPSTAMGRYAYSSQMVSPPNTALPDLSLAITPQSVTDKVLVFLNMDAIQVTGQADIQTQILSGMTTVGTRAGFGFADSISISVGAVDAPATTSQVSYTPSVTRGSTSFPSSQAVINGGGTTAQIYAFAVPGSLVFSSTLSAVVSITTSTTWVTSNLAVTVTPQTFNDRVLLMFNADMIFLTGPQYKVSLTIYRGVTNLGDDMQGLLTIDAISPLYARRSPLMMYMDSPGTTATVIYTVAVRVGVVGQTVEFGRGGLESSLHAVLLTEGPVPTAAPSPPPSLVPTAIPTAPTAIPTAAATTDCTAGCAVAGGGFIYPGSQFNLGTHRLTSYFSIYFRFTHATGWAAGVPNNIMRFVDFETGATLFAVGMSSPPLIDVTYNNQQVVTAAPLLSGNFNAVWTGLSFTVSAYGLSVYSDQTGYSATVPVSLVNTYGRAYTIYVSYPGWTSSGGQVSTMSISGVNEHSHNATLVFVPS